MLYHVTVSFHFSYTIKTGKAFFRGDKEKFTKTKSTKKASEVKRKIHYIVLIYIYYYIDLDAGLTRIDDKELVLL